MSREGSLAKNTAIITLGKLCTQFVSFLLLPLYTALLSTDEYGTVDLFGTYQALVLPLATLLVEQGAFRFLITQAEENTTKEKIVSSSLFIIAGLNALFVLLGVLFFPYYDNPYKYYLIPMLVTASFLNWCMQLARGFQKLTLYSMGSVICGGISLVLNVLFIAGFGMGAGGMLLASVFGNLCAALFLFLRLRILSFLDIRGFDKKLSGRMLAYSVPLIPNTLSFWIIGSSDRMIVNHFFGVSAVGILALSHKFPQAIQSVFNFSNVAWYEMGVVHWKDDDRDAFFSRTTDTVLRAFSGICILAMGFLPLLFRLFVRGAGYQEAYMTIPIYLVAVLCSVASGLMGVVYISEKKTTEIARTTILAGIVNVAVHLALFRSIGLYAAALSTLIAYLCAVIIRVFDTRKYLRMEINGRHILFIVAALAATGVCCYSSSAAVRLTGCGISVVCSFLLNRDTLWMLLGVVKKFLHRKNHDRHG